MPRIASRLTDCESGSPKSPRALTPSFELGRVARSAPRAPVGGRGRDLQRSAFSRYWSAARILDFQRGLSPEQADARPPGRRSSGDRLPHALECLAGRTECPKSLHSWTGSFPGRPAPKRTGGSREPEVARGGTAQFSVRTKGPQKLACTAGILLGQRRLNMNHPNVSRAVV